RQYSTEKRLISQVQLTICKFMWVKDLESPDGVQKPPAVTRPRDIGFTRARNGKEACVSTFPVEVFLQFRGVQFDLGAALGHIDLGTPQDGIDDQSAEVLVAPVAVKMSAREAEAAAALVALERPGDDLLAPLVLFGISRAAGVVGWRRL